MKKLRKLGINFQTHIVIWRTLPFVSDINNINTQREVHTCQMTPVKVAFCK